MTASPLHRHTATAGARSPVQRRDAAPVVAATVLLRHGLDDGAIMSYLARSWPLDEVDCRSAVDAARILLRREQPHDADTAVAEPRLPG
jgi:hypothetical protein